MLGEKTFPHSTTKVKADTLSLKYILVMYTLRMPEAVIFFDPNIPTPWNLSQGNNHRKIEILK